MKLEVDMTARHILEIVPVIMKEIRMEMRKNRGSDLSVIQFRALSHLNGNPETSLAELAEHVGLTASSTSTLVDGLVEKGLVERRDSPEDRRRLSLTLTEEGLSVLDSAMAAALNRLASRIDQLPGSDQAVIEQAMQILKQVYIDEERALS